MIEKGKSRRFEERQVSSLNVQVRCQETMDDHWEELTRLIDYSRLGARFVIGRVVEAGQLLHLSFAMPRHLRAFDLTAPQYQVWALVRTVREIAVSGFDALSFEVGVALVGSSAPANYLANPSKRYDLKPVPARDGLWQVRERARNEEY